MTKVILYNQSAFYFISIMLIVRGSLLIEVMVRVDCWKNICYRVHSCWMHNADPRHVRYASPVIVSGISWEPRVDLIASLIASGFTESTINLYWFDDTITLASRKPSGLKEMPVISYHIHWTELSGTRCVDCYIATDVSGRRKPICYYVGSQVISPVAIGTPWALSGWWEQSRPYHGVSDRLWHRTWPDEPLNNQAGKFVIIHCRQRNGGPPRIACETDKPTILKGEVVA